MPVITVDNESQPEQTGDHRSHGGLGGQTPYERLKQRTPARV
jgi:hypothetical protein